MPRRNRNVCRRCPGCHKKVPLSAAGTVRPHTCSSGNERPERLGIRKPDKREGNR